MTTTTITSKLIKLRLRRGSRSDEVQLSPAPLQVATGLVDIVIPVYNEAHSLPECIDKLSAYLETSFPYDYRITVVDNGSTDLTWQVAQQLQVARPKLHLLHLGQKGRGRALKYAWSRSSADVLAYMDVDLSTDLSSLEPLVTPLLSGTAAVATGSRLQRASRVKRSFKRECISRTYNHLLRAIIGLRTSDAQCGFKAIRADVASRLLPQISDTNWFFDTELLSKAESQGLIVHEVAVDWREDSDSRVNIRKTVVEDLRGIRRLKRERDTRPTWEKWTIVGMLVVAALVYIIGMTKNGYGNSFYAAAVQAGTHSWKAFFFGSLDASNYITVDKPPFALWVMELSTRIFGFHTWSMLLPDALAGVGTVHMVYATVRRWFSSASALIAAGVMALTPVAVMMFGFNNPDAVLTLLLTASMYSFTRALENKRPLRWLSLTGLLTGCAFNTKMLQGLFLLPIFAVVYLIAAPPAFLQRLRHLICAAIPTAIAALWWPIIVSLVPTTNRPYIGSSSNNSIWNLIFGYNGFSRLLGKGSGQGGSHNSGMGSGLGGGMPTTSRVGTGSRPTLSGSAGTMPTPPTGSGTMTNTAHAMAQGMGAPTGTLSGSMGGHMTGHMSGHSGPGGTGFGGSTGILRMFNSDFGPNIAWFIGAALLGGLLVLWITRHTKRTNRTRTTILAWGGWLMIHIVLFSMVSGVIHPYYPVVMAPAIAALIGITLPHMLAEYKRRRTTALILPLAVAVTGITACVMLGYDAAWLPWLRWIVLGLSLMSALGLIIQLLLPIQKLLTPLLIVAAIACASSPVAFSLATISVAHTGSIPTAGPEATAMAGSSNVSAGAESSFVKYLLAHKGSARWLVAVASANESAPIQISSGQPVMAVGGFSGSDNALSVSQLEKLVASGELRYYAVSSGTSGRGGGMGQGGNSTILSWVEQHGTKVSYGGTDYTLYNLASTSTSILTLP